MQLSSQEVETDESCALSRDDRGALSSHLATGSRAEFGSAALKKCKRAEMTLVSTQKQVPFVSRQLEETSRMLVSVQGERKKQVGSSGVSAQLVVREHAMWYECY